MPHAPLRAPPLPPAACRPTTWPPTCPSILQCASHFTTSLTPLVSQCIHGYVTCNECLLNLRESDRCNCSTRSIALGQELIRNRFTEAAATSATAATAYTAATTAASAAADFAALIAAAEALTTSTATATTDTAATRKRRLGKAAVVAEVEAVAGAVAEVVAEAVEPMEVEPDGVPSPACASVVADRLLFATAYSEPVTEMTTEAESETDIESETHIDTERDTESDTEIESDNKSMTEINTEIEAVIATYIDTETDIKTHSETETVAAADATDATDAIADGTANANDATNATAAPALVATIVATEATTEATTKATAECTTDATEGATTGAIADATDEGVFRCWGAVLSDNGSWCTGVEYGSMKVSFNGRFCATCLRDGFSLPTYRVRALYNLIDKPVLNNTRNGVVWNVADVSGIPPFRIVNNTFNCSGPGLVIFHPSYSVQPIIRTRTFRLAAIPETWLSADRQSIHLRVSASTYTLIPSANLRPLARERRVPVRAE